MFKLFSSNTKNASANEELVAVTLKEGTAKAPFSKDSAFAPNANGGYDVFVNTNDFKWYQVAAKTIASLKLYNFEFKSDVALSELELYWFLTALYDGKHDYTVSCDYAQNVLDKVAMTVNTVSVFRKIADSDSKISTPEKVINVLFDLVKEAADAQGDSASLKLIKRGDLEFEKYAGLNAVGFASDEDPCMGIIDYVPKCCQKDSPVQVALVGKGITFDTGGYSLKPDKYMETMRTDKTAVVYLCGAVTLAAKLGIKKHVRLYLCCSENMVSGRGMLPGDIVTYPNGISVEINNTDAEGRLVLADGLLQAGEDKAQYVLDMATLTGAAKIAVGRDMFSVLTKEKELDKSLVSAFEKTGEMYWQLPLAQYHRRFLSSRRATVTNSGHGEGAPGSSVAASFLEQFVDKNTPWVHIDLSSAYLPDGSPFLAAGPTGSTILGLATWLCE